MTQIEIEIKEKLKKLIAQYADVPELQFLHNRNMNSFDITQVPKTMQDFVKLVTSKSPSFSNISALAVANFVISNLFGQIRARIYDPIYSDDMLGLNTYSTLIARSGQGKDSAYQALVKATTSATEFINELQKEEAREKARIKFCKQMKQGNPEFNELEVKLEDYQDLIKPIEDPIGNLDSTRGGITSSLNTMEKENYGTQSFYSSEFGMAIQTGKDISKVFELFSTLFDMGKSVSPKFKTEESKEESVNGMFINFLGVSSPTPFYQAEGRVRKEFIPLLTTSFARRTIFIFSSAREEFENKYVPESPMEKAKIRAESRQLIQTLTNSIDLHMKSCIKQAVEDPVVMFDEEAAAIYDAYKSYLEDMSEAILLQDESSVEGLEMAGRAFKLGRIAGLWALAENTRVISKEVLIGAIYFADYAANHLKRFVKTLQLQDYELFINDWQQGFFDNVLPIDKAITKGYINVKQITNQSLTNFLKPVNSKLEGIATVSYNDKANAFIFVPAVKNLDTAYTYRACQGHVTTRPISNIAVDKPMSALNQLLSIQCSFNPFAQETAKFVTFTVNESFLSMQMINKYLINTHHYIATSTDPSNMHAFTIILPINTVISKAEYKYVTMSIANQLMLKVLPEHCEHDHITYGYADAISLSATDNATLFDISGILGNLASGASVPLLATKPAVKPAPATVQRYVKDDILQHKQVLIDMLNASSNPILLFASVVYDMYVHGVDKQKVVDIVNSINSSLIKSIPEHIKEQYLIEPFNNL